MIHIKILIASLCIWAIAEICLSRYLISKGKENTTILLMQILGISIALIDKQESVLANNGLNLPEGYHWFRQLRLGNYGILDIVGFKLLKFDESSYVIDVQLIELKKDEININTACQAYRYRKGLLRLINIKAEGSPIDVDISIYLIGRDLKTYGDDIYLLQEIDINIIEYNLSLLDGVSFKHIYLYQGYHLTDEDEIYNKDIDQIHESLLLDRRMLDNQKLLT